MFIVAFVIGFALGWATERLIPMANRGVRLAIPVLWAVAGFVAGALLGPEVVAFALGFAVAFGWSWARAASASTTETHPRQ